MIETGHILVGHQPAYLPWGGYFSRILDVDKFLLLDHVQFSARSWQQRNFVLGHNGAPQLLTVPVHRRHGQRIIDARIAGDRWRLRHWRIISQAYRKAPYWPLWEARLASLYSRPWASLARLNEAFIALLMDGFGINVELLRSSTLNPVGRKTEMLVDLCRITGTQTLRVGTGATAYLDPRALTKAEVGVEVATYTNPPYGQGRPGFTANLSALDLLLRCGPGAREVLRAGAGLRPWTPRAVQEWHP